MADNNLGKLVYIEHYGSVKVANKSGKWTGTGKYSKSNDTKKWKKLRSNVDKVKGTKCSLYYDTYQKWGAKKSNKKQVWTRQNYEKHAKGFLSTLGSNYADDSVKWVNTWVCDSAEGVSVILNNNGGKKFKTPSVCDISFQDIDVEVDDETKKKTVTDVGRGQTGYLKRNRVRANVIKIELEWNFLTPSEAKTLLQLLSYSGHPWLWVCFHNPYTNAISTKKMYAGDRSISATYNGNYISLKVSLIEY